MSNSNNGSVDGSGGATPSVSPYSSEMPEHSESTGTSRDGRSISTEPGRRRTPPPPPDGSQSGSSLTERRVRHHETLRTFPADEGYRPLSPETESGRSASSPEPEDNELSDIDAPPEGPSSPVLASSEPRPSPEATPLSEAEPSPEVPPSPETLPSPNQQATVSAQLDPLPPLTADQEEQTNRLISAVTTAAGFIQRHKNVAAMITGGVLLAISAPLSAVAPGFGIFAAVTGFQFLNVGFSCAMMSEAGEGQAPVPNPNPNPAPDPNEQGESGRAEESSPSSNPGNSSNERVGGRFVKVDKVPGSEGADEVSGTAQLEAEHLAQQRHWVALQQHMAADIEAALERESERSSGGGSVASVSAPEGGEPSSSIETEILHIASEYAVRAGLEVTSEVADTIVEAGRMIGQALAGEDAMTERERKETFQQLFTTLVQQSGASPAALKSMCFSIDNLVETQGSRLNQAVRDILASTSALLKTMGQASLPSDITIPTTVANPETGTRETKKLTAEQREAVLRGDLSLILDMNNGHQVRLLEDAIIAHSERLRVEGKSNAPEVEQIRNRVLTDAFDLLETETATTKDFRAALLDKVNSPERVADREFLEPALDHHPWFKVK